MNNKEPWSEDEIWDRVVDGQLSPGQLAELVAACDRQPDLWKRCALAFLEDQAFRTELGRFARDEMDADTCIDRVARSAIESRNVVTHSPALPRRATEASPPAQQPQDVGAMRTTKSALWNNLALAASLLVCTGIGWQAAQRFGGRDSQFIGPENESARLVTSDEPENARISGSVVDNVASQGTTARSIDPAAIEQMNAEALANTMQVNLKEQLGPEYQKLRQRGYEVQTQEGFVPIWLHDGSSAVIPYSKSICDPGLLGKPTERFGFCSQNKRYSNQL